MKECSKCGALHDHNHRWCRPCQRQNELDRSRTILGLCDSIYHQQCRSSRKRGADLPEYSKEDFREWMQDRDNFMELYTAWQESDYDSDMRPSVDRLDDADGYHFGNILLTTWGENRKHSYHSNRLGKHKHNVPVRQLEDGKVISEFPTYAEAERQTGINRGSIYRACNGKQKTAGGYKWELV